MFNNPFIQHCAFATVKITTDLVPDYHALELAKNFKHLGRKYQFYAGRIAAKAALEQAQGVQKYESQFVAEAGLVGVDGRRPKWPEGTVGSISHCKDWAVAIVNLARVELKSLGVDIENLNRPYSSRLPDRILHPQEQSLWQTELQQDPQFLLRLACCKEAVYKCWNQATHQPLFWQQIQVLELTTNQFSAQTAVFKGTWQGCWQQTEHFGLAAVLWV